MVSTSECDRGVGRFLYGDDAVMMSPTLFGILFGQWNSENQQVLLNFRINWISSRKDL